MLHTLVRRGGAAWPQFAVPAAEFEQYLLDRVAARPDRVQALAALRVEDLYLACACARGDAAALEALERGAMTQVREQLRRRGYAADLVDEALQRLREKLFVPTGDAP